MAQPNEFWVVSVPDDATTGASLRLLAVHPSADDAKTTVTNLPADVTGRVVVLARTVMFVRAMAVTTTESEAPIIVTEG
jgi:hypothetical protein